MFNTQHITNGVLHDVLASPVFTQSIVTKDMLSPNGKQ